MSRAECAAVQARFHFVGMWRSGTCGWHVRQRSSPLFRRPLGEPRSSPGHQAPCSRLGPLRTTNPHVSSTRIMYNESARLAFLANQISTLLNEIRSAARPGARPPRPGGKRQAHTSRATRSVRVTVSRNHVPTSTLRNDGIPARVGTARATTTPGVTRLLLFRIDVRIPASDYTRGSVILRSHLWRWRGSARGPSLRSVPCVHVRCVRRLTSEM